MKTLSTFVVAAAQVVPVFLDRKATLEKACGVINDASKNGAKLVVFPEAFFPAYPEWVWVTAGGQGDMLDALYAELVENSIAVPDDATEKLCQTARTAKINVVIGINERNREASNASLYNSLLYIDDTGKILGSHRKLIPTAGERTVWSQGNGSTLEAYDTSVGKLGGLICWENYMPLARNAMYAWGTQIYVAPTWDQGDMWVSHIATHCKRRWYVCDRMLHALNLNDIPNPLRIQETLSRRNNVDQYRG